MAKFGGITLVDIKLMDEYKLHQAIELCEKELERLEFDNNDALKSGLTKPVEGEEYKEVEEFLSILKQEEQSRVARPRYFAYKEISEKEVDNRSLFEFLISDETQIRSMLKSQFNMQEEDIEHFLRNVTQEKIEQLKNMNKGQKVPSSKSYNAQPRDQIIHLTGKMSDVIRLRAEVERRLAHGDESEKAELHEFIEKLSLRTVDGKRLIPKKRCYAAEAILRDIQNKKDMIQLLTTDPNLVGEEQPGE